MLVVAAVWRLKLLLDIVVIDEVAAILVVSV